MAIRNLIGPGTGDSTEFGTTSGTLSIVSSPTPGSWASYALRTNPTGSGLGYVAPTFHSASNGTGSQNPSLLNGYSGHLYFRFSFRYATKAATNDEPILATIGDVGALFTVALSSTGVLQAYDPSLTLIGTGATVLSAGTWYTIQAHMHFDAAGAWEVKINGTTEISGTADFTTAGDTDLSRPRLGKASNFNSNSVDYYYADIALSDDAYPSSDLAISYLYPSANGNYQTWSIGAGSGSHYQVVDEVPHNSDTDYLLSTGVTDNAETEAIADTSGTQITSTIHATKSFAIFKRNGGTNGGVRMRTRSATTDSDLASNFTTTSSYTICAAILETDPATASAWTTSGIDGVEVGARERSANTSRMTLAGLAVAHTTPSPPPPPSSSLGMPLGSRGTAFNGGRTFAGIIR